MEGRVLSEERGSAARRAFGAVPEADAELAARAAAGEEGALASLYDRYVGRVYDFVLRTTHDRRAARDLASAAIVDALRGLEHNGPEHGVRGRVFGAARERVDEWLGARGEDDARPTPDDASGFEVARPGALASPAMGGPGPDALKAVWAVAAALPAWQYAALDLHARQGLEGPELAQALGTPAGDAVAAAAAAQRDLERGAAKALEGAGLAAASAGEIFAALAPVPLPIEVRNAAWRDLTGKPSNGTAPHVAPAPAPAPAPAAPPPVPSLAPSRPAGAPPAPWILDEARVPATLDRPVRLRDRDRAGALPVAAAALVLLVLGLGVGLLSRGPGALLSPLGGLAAGGRDAVARVGALAFGAEPTASAGQSIALASPATPEPTPPSPSPAAQAVPVPPTATRAPAAAPPTNTSAPPTPTRPPPTNTVAPPSPTAGPPSPTPPPPSPTRPPPTEAPPEAPAPAAAPPPPTATPVRVAAAQPTASPTPRPPPPTNTAPPPPPPTDTPAPPPPTNTPRPTQPPPPPPGQVRVPNVVGMPEAQARATISQAGLNNTYTNYQGPGDVPPNVLNSVPPGSVLSQNPGGGTLVQPGTTVYIAVRKA